MSKKTRSWETYEEVARYLLDEIAEKFDLACFEGKQTVPGQVSGTEWEIDAKGITEGQDTFVIVECRRYTSTRIDQEQVAGLAYRIHDTGAQGGIIVSPLGLQEGAKKVAAAQNIASAPLT